MHRPSPEKVLYPQLPIFISSLHDPQSLFQVLKLKLDFRISDSFHLDSAPVMFPWWLVFQQARMEVGHASCSVARAEVWGMGLAAVPNPTTHVVDNHFCQHQL